MAQAAERRRGEVISFYDTRGYGFIKPEDGGEEVFVHHSSIQSDGYRTLIKGSIVEFACDVSEDNKCKAVDVTGPNGSAIHPPPRRSGGECYKCGAHGHIARDCESRRVEEGGPPGDGACYNCGEHGHLARNCSEKNDSRGSGGCYNCGKSGHFARECPRGGGGGGGGRRIECYTCGGFGHFARECPSAGGGRYGGGGDECFNCGNQGHFARNCPEVSVRK